MSDHRSGANSRVSSSLHNVRHDQRMGPHAVCCKPPSPDSLLAARRLVPRLPVRRLAVTAAVQHSAAAPPPINSGRTTRDQSCQQSVPNLCRNPP